MNSPPFTRRQFLAASATTTLGARPTFAERADVPRKKAQIAITFDLEMSRHYPERGMLEWDYQKGNLDQATKRYSVEAARIARQQGGTIHFFCVGRVLEQEKVDWLKEIAAAGHPIGNHTYDHVNVLATKPEEIQYRFRRSPWLIAGRSIPDILHENIRLTSIALKQRAGIEANGFRTPGGFPNGLVGREDIQQMLLAQGFTWASCKYPRFNRGKPKEPPTAKVFGNIVRAQADAQPFRYKSGLVEIPMSPISDDHAFRDLFWNRRQFLKAIRLIVEWTIENRAVFDFLCHPSIMLVEDPRHETVQLICDLVQKARGKAEIVGLDKIATG